MGVLAGFISPNPDRIFIIGVGSGATIYHAALNPDVKRIRAVEIRSSELNILNQLAKEGDGVLVNHLFQDSRIEIEIGDARKVLATSPELFDVIESDPVKSKRPFSGLLYSKEFFELVKSKLNEKGILVQWQATRRVLSTVLSVFPYVTAYQGLLLASSSPISLDPASILNRLDKARLTESTRLPGARIEQIREFFTKDTVQTWTPLDPRDSTDILTDLRPKDEFYLNNTP
jgi:spermidine synthase